MIHPNTLDSPQPRTPTAPIPADPNARLRRVALAAALNAAGFPVATATLATMATRGGGPQYRLFGRIPLYRWSDALTWAEAKLTAPQTSTSAGDAAKDRA